MSPITKEEALKLVAPDIDDADARDESARRIMEGVAANDAYWQGRGPLEAAQAAVAGHGEVVRAPDAESTAMEESPSQPAIGTGTGTPSGNEPSDAAPPDANNDDAERLRAQLRAAGIDPAA